jgi:hypothetical protein
MVLFRYLFGGRELVEEIKMHYISCDIGGLPFIQLDKII